MKVLITGASGLLAGRLAKYFLENTNYKIFLVGRKEFVFHFESSRLEYHKVDWECEQNIQDLCKGLDIVFHFAGFNFRQVENAVD